LKHFFNRRERREHKGAGHLLEIFVAGGALGFVFGGDAAGQGFARGEFGAADLAFAFQLFFGCDAEAGPRDGFEALVFDGFAGQFADAIGAAINAHQGFIDFVDGVLLGGNPAQGEVAIEAVSAGIRHVEAEGGLFFAGVFDEIILAIEEVVAGLGEATEVLFPLLGDARGLLGSIAMAEDIGGGGTTAAG
jgi:hypothetical protein